MPYPASSILIGVLAYIFYAIFSIMVRETFAGSNKYTILINCALIALLFFAIQYFLDKIRESFGNLKIQPERESPLKTPLNQLEENFTRSKKFYVLVLLVFMPFLAIDIIFKPSFYLENPNVWTLLLDIYNKFISYLTLYLLAVILWMIFNISWILRRISDRQYSKLLKIELLDADKTGGLKQIRELVIWFCVCYFIVIILYIMTYFTYRGLLLYESLSLIAFWVIGVIFFLNGWYMLRRLLMSKIENDIDYINEMIEDKRVRLLNLLSKKEEKEHEDQMKSISNTLDIISKERDRILQCGIRPMDAKSLIVFVSSSILSLIAILDKFSNNKIAIYAISSIQPHIYESISHLSQFFPR